jgi:hypothetical protein
LKWGAHNHNSNLKFAFKGPLKGDSKSTNEFLKISTLSLGFAFYPLEVSLIPPFFKKGLKYLRLCYKGGLFLKKGVLILPPYKP